MNKWTKEKRIEKFWEKVDKSKGPDACWNWTAYLEKNGYGRMWWGEKRTLAHRVSWELINGPIPDGLYVCHSCDNPACCNPKHLWLGTNKDNQQDSVKKGRNADFSGEKHPMHKLTWMDVEKIKYEYSQTDITQQELADRFDVCVAEICNIISGKQWKENK